MWGAWNLLPDYLSLLQTRWVLRRLEARGSAALVVVDLVITAFIAIAGHLLFMFGQTIFALAVSLSDPSSFHDVVSSFSGDFEWWLDHIRDLVTLDSTSTPLTLGIFVYSTFLTSVWLWLYLAAGAAVRVAGGFNVGLRWLRGFTDLDEQPFRSLGFAAILITTLIFLAGIPLILLT